MFKIINLHSASLKYIYFQKYVIIQNEIRVEYTFLDS